MSVYFHFTGAPSMIHSVFISLSPIADTPSQIDGQKNILYYKIIRIVIHSEAVHCDPIDFVGE